MFVWSEMPGLTGTSGTCLNVRDRYETIASVVLTEVWALPENVRNEMDLASWAHYTMKAMRQEFPGMSVLTQRVGFVSAITLWVKEWVMSTSEWVAPDGPYRTLGGRLIELHQRRERAMMSESRAYERFIQKVWRYTIRRTSWDYDRSVRFVEEATKRWIEHETRHMGDMD